MIKALFIISTLVLAGCASSDRRYLASVSLETPSSVYGRKIDRFNKGKPTTDEGPFPEDFPPSRTLIFQDERSYAIFVEGKPVYAFPARNVVRLYDLKDISDDRTIVRYVQNLKKALSERRNARELERPYTSLPDFPRRNAGHLVQDNVRYVDFPWGRGVFYLCAFTQGPGNFLNNDELIYLFQGLSTDERLYVSADFRVTSDLLKSITPPPADAGSSTVDDAAEAIAKKLDQETDDSFYPNLSTIRSWMQTLKIPASH